MWIRQLTLLSWEIPSLNPYLVAYVLLDKVINPHSLVPQSGLKAVGPLVAYMSVFFLHSGEIDVPNFWCTQWLQSQSTQEFILEGGGVGGVLVTNAAGGCIFILKFIVSVIWVSKEPSVDVQLEVVPDDFPLLVSHDDFSFLLAVFFCFLSSSARMIFMKIRSSVIHTPDAR